MNIKRLSSLKKGIIIKLRKIDKGGIRMATQIMATPILYGKEAQKVLKEVKTMPSEKSKENGKKLLELFKSVVKGE